MNDALGIIAVAVAVVSYGAYIRNTIKGDTKPHAVTWLIWALLNGFVFLEQMIGGAGPGAWVTGFASFANLVIFLLAVRRGERHVTIFDWVCLALVLGLFVFWSRISDPDTAVLIAIVIFLAGLIPTLRKASKNAHEETALTFGLNGVKFFLALMALEIVTVTTALYPLTLFVVNSAFALYLLIARSRQGLPKKKRIVKKRKRT